MFNKHILNALGAILLVNLATAAAMAADQSECKNCIGNSLVELIREYNESRHCWFTKNHHILLKEKIYVMQAVVEFWYQAEMANNELVEEKCKTDVQIKPCTMSDPDELSECLVSALSTLVHDHRDLEKCHGKAINSNQMKTATRLLLGSTKGWKLVHPDC